MFFFKFIYLFFISIVFMCSTACKIFYLLILLQVTSFLTGGINDSAQAPIIKESTKPLDEVGDWLYNYRSCRRWALCKDCVTRVDHQSLMNGKAWQISSAMHSIHRTNTISIHKQIKEQQHHSRTSKYVKGNKSRQR